MRVLVLGASGMLGSAVFNQFLNDKKFKVWGTVRDINKKNFFPKDTHELLIHSIDVLDHDCMVDLFTKLRPDVVINCVGLIKQLSDAHDPLCALPMNAILPHRLARLCLLTHARLIHISTDCVFSGRKGMYVESDISDAEDLYGKSKYIGELHDLPQAITLRTSIIGHELNSKTSLVDWFLTQSDSVKGYTKAIFSGLPTVEFAMVIKDYVIPNVELYGLYHVSVKAIDKYSLLKLIATVYGKSIEIIPDEKLLIDRSLDSTRFQQATGYKPPSWEKLIKKMNKAHKGF